MGINLPRQQQGFILAAVLWTLAVMFIAVAAFHSYVERKRAIGLAAKENIQARLDGISTEQTLLYLLASNRMTYGGMSLSPPTPAQLQGDEWVIVVGDEVWLDDTLYQGVGVSQFQLQDNSGLIAINMLDRSPLEYWLRHLEPDQALRAHLLAALQDYTDADDFVSLGGAESMEYQRGNMPTPTNDFLRTEPELLQVMGWREWFTAHPEADVQNEFTTARWALLNPNVMPRNLLEHFYGFSGPLIDKILTERHVSPFLSAEDFAIRVGLMAAPFEESYQFFPSGNLRIRIQNKRGGQARLISLQLTPNGLMGPWLVDYEHSVQTLNNDNEALAIRQSTLFNHPLDTGQ